MSFDQFQRMGVRNFIEQHGLWNVLDLIRELAAEKNIHIDFQIND